MKISDTRQLGQLIRGRRKELMFTQAYLAEFTGFSVSFISDLEHGKPTCEIGKTLHLMSLLGLDIIAERRGSDAQTEGAD